MRRLLLILFALAAFSTPMAAAHAQSADSELLEGQVAAEQEFRDDLARWTRVLDRVGKQLQAGDLTPAVLDQLRGTVVDLEKQLAEVRVVVRADVDRSQNLVEALGPAPKEGEPPESGDIVAQRETLNERLAEDSGRLKQLDVLIQQSREYLSQISAAESAALDEQLLTRTPSVLSPETWRDAGEDIAALSDRARGALNRWRNSEQVKDAGGGGFVLGALLAVLTVGVLAYFLRGWLFKTYGRRSDIEHPSYRRRALATLVEAAARTATPILVVGAIYIAAYASGVLFGFAKVVALGAVAAVIIVSIVYGLPRAMLSPSQPQWRLVAIGDSAAKLWYRYAVTLAGLVGLDVLLSVPVADLRPGEALSSIYGLCMNGAYAIVFLSLATDKRLWLTPEQEAREAASAVEPPPTALSEPAPRNRWWLVGRIVVAAIAIAIPATLLAEYGVLSDFIASRLIATTGVFLIALVLHGLARDLVGIFTLDPVTPTGEPDKTTPLYVWSVLFLDVGLVLAMAFLIVPLWGGNWDSIFDRLGWSLTGFKIGGRVFSITDVLTGMVTFIILIALLRTVQRFINRRVLQNMRMDSGVRNSLSTGIGYAGLVIALLVAINATGIDLSGLTIIAGALSVGVGFGLQSIVNNFVSGLILLAERPIKVGDWVEVGSHQGIVQRISVRSTEIKTFERSSVIVPNSELIASPVVNWMHRDKQGRVEIRVGVAYGSDIDKVRKVLLQCAADNSELSKTPEPFVLFMDFADSALLFELRAFLPDVNRRLRVSSELRFAIDEAFHKAGIEVPFPQRDVHIKEASIPAAAPARSARAAKRPAPKRAPKAAAKTKK